MAKKSLGYVHLEWTCPNCDTRNPGPQRICGNCGAPQPDNVEFQQPAQETLISDEAEIARAKSGPDIHCFYCGTRNLATAETCSQCGATLSEGSARRHGDVLGAHRDKQADPIICPACGTENAPNEDICVQCSAALPRPPATPPAQSSSTATPATPGAVPSLRPPAGSRSGSAPNVDMRKIGLVGGLLICALATAVYFLFIRTTAVTGQVAAIEWERQISIEQLMPVTYETWHDEIPSQAERGQCTLKLHHTQDQPAPNAKEVCGTPYTTDTGSGFGEVVQDCQYQVYDDWCEYTVDEWQAVDTHARSGADFNPQWPTFQLSANQRAGERDETYRCFFQSKQGDYTYATHDMDRFTRCEIGSRWVLDVNTLGGVQSINPAE